MGTLPIVSVIVPVYNAEPFLALCLQSLGEQTLADMEFLLVNDGSTDNSGAVCKEFEATDPRFRVISKENAGVSAARNTGLREAKGEFVGFLDADDTVRPEMFADLLALAQWHEADIAVCDSEAVDGQRPPVLETIGVLSHSCLLERSEITPEQLLELAGSVGRCLYRKTLFEQEGAAFPVGLRFSEDRIFNLYAMGRARRIYYTKTVYYERLLHPESAVHKFYPNYFDIVKDAAQRTREALAAAWDNDARFQTAYLAQFVGGSLAAINNYFYRTATLSHRERVQKVRVLCEDKELRETIQSTGLGGLRGKWILKKRVWTLSLCAQLLNWRYGR